MSQCITKLNSPAGLQQDAMGSNTDASIPSIALRSRLHEWFCNVKRSLKLHCIREDGLI